MSTDEQHQSTPTPEDAGPHSEGLGGPVPVSAVAQSAGTEGATSEGATSLSTDAPSGEPSAAEPAGPRDEQVSGEPDAPASAAGSVAPEPHPAGDDGADPGDDVDGPGPDGAESDEQSSDEPEAGPTDGSADVADADADSDDDDDDDADADGDDVEGTATAPRGAAARLEREGEIAADFLERLLDIADLDGDLDVDVEGERASVAIVDSSEGRVPRRLVGPNGEVLDALQELARLAVQARTGDRTRLMLDIAGHRARRREQLVVRAQDAINQVRESGEPLRLEAMNPFERKIVHDAVSAAGLSSSSEGVEPDRRIVVRPAG